MHLFILKIRIIYEHSHYCAKTHLVRVVVIRVLNEPVNEIASFLYPADNKPLK